MNLAFSGIDDLNRVAVTLKAAGVRAQVQGDRLTRSAAFAVQANAMVIAPVDTGTLRQSITVEFHGGLLAGGLVAVVAPQVSYGYFVEFGTSRQAPQAFMGPSLDRVTPAYVAAIAALSDPFGGGVISGGFRG